MVDDLEMGVTHVIRGEDHLSNTVNHIELFRAFGSRRDYAHIPLILNPDGTKMSKRDHGRLAVRVPANGLCAGGGGELPRSCWAGRRRRPPTAVPGGLIERFDLPQVLRAQRPVRHGQAAVDEFRDH